MNNLKFLRENNNLTQKMVAEKLKISQGAISQWESSETFPKAVLLLKLAAMYNCSTEELLQDKTEITKSDKVNILSEISTEKQTNLFDELK